MVLVNNRIVSIVDDDPSTVLFFHEALKRIPGITIITFTNPVLALEHFQEYDYAYVLVISDLKMSPLDGMELLKNIKHPLYPYPKTLEKYTEEILKLEPIERVK